MNGVVFRDGRRGEGIILLAGSLFDYFPNPKGATFKKGSSKKKGASHYEPCLECGGSWLIGEKTGERAGYRKGRGVKRDRFKREVPCEPCGGFLKEDGTIVAGAGLLGIDRMTGSQVGTEKTYAVVGKDQWPCNVCLPINPRAKRGTGVDGKDADGNDRPCRACGGTGTREASKGLRFDVKPAEIADVTLSAVERGLELRNSLGDYHELDVCLAELARRSVHRWRVFHAVHVVGSKSPGLISETEARLLAQAVRDLLDWMPREIRVPHEVVAGARREGQKALRGREVSEGQRAERDAAWRERYRAGETTAAIAVAEGVDRSTVDRGIRRVA